MPMPAQLTARAKIALGKMGIKVSHDGGRGGLEHRFYLDKLKRHFIEKGYFTYLEKDNIDLIAEKGDEVVAVQVETGKSAKRNIQSLIGHKADRKVLVVTNKQAELRVREISANLDTKSKIEIVFVKDFFQQLPLAKLPPKLS